VRSGEARDPEHCRVGRLLQGPDVPDRGREDPEIAQEHRLLRPAPWEAQPDRLLRDEKERPDPARRNCLALLPQRQEEVSLRARRDCKSQFAGLSQV